MPRMGRIVYGTTRLDEGLMREIACSVLLVVLSRLAKVATLYSQQALNLPIIKVLPASRNLSERQQALFARDSPRPEPPLRKPCTGQYLVTRLHDARSSKSTV
jgi:hypothetical protein